MDYNDLINGAFELGCSYFTCRNAWQMHLDKKLRGVYWGLFAFTTAWGIWNLHYYPHLDQWFSFVGGIFVVSGNLAWLVLAWRYRKN